MLQLPTALEHLNLEVSGTVPWQWSITHSVLLVLPFHYKHPLSCVWLCHTSAIQLDIFYALGWFLGVKLSQNPSFQPVNIKWLCQHLFLFFFLFSFFLNTFFSSQGQILSWCLQFTTTVYLPTCCCYVGKLQTVQKALCFRGIVNSHLGMSLFSFRESGLAWALAKTSGSYCVMQNLRAGQHRVAESDPDVAPTVPR